jgi:hypothetical protein
MIIDNLNIIGLEISAQASYRGKNYKTCQVAGLKKVMLKDLTGDNCNTQLKNHVFN